MHAPAASVIVRRRRSLVGTRESCVKALVLAAVLVVASGHAFAQDALAQPKAAKARGVDPTTPVAARPAPVSRPVAPVSLPASVPEQFSPPQEAYASFPQAEAVAPAKPSAC